MKQTANQKRLARSIVDNCLSVRLRLINRKLGSLYDEVLRPHGIKASQLNILVAVSAHGQANSYQLCKMLHMDASTFSRALTRLRKRGWLKAEPSGKGKILRIEITGSGVDKIEQVYPDWQRAQEKAVETLGELLSEMIIYSVDEYILGQRKT